MSKRKRGRTTPYTSEELRNLWAVKRSETDRGRVLATAAVIDNSLEVLLRQKFKQDSGVSDKFLNELISHGKSPPLGTFAVKSAMARACGLIDEQTLKALDILRDIRNDAAHMEEAFKLDDERLNGIASTFNEHEAGYFKLWQKRLRTHSRKWRFYLIADMLLMRITAVQKALEGGVKPAEALQFVRVHYMGLRWEDDQFKLPSRRQSG